MVYKKKKNLELYYLAMNKSNRNSSQKEPRGGEVGMKD